CRRGALPVLQRHGAAVMPKMSGEDDPEAFLETFERAALATGLERAKWAGHLGMLLVGQAQAAYRTMSRGDMLDFNKVKAEILRQLDIMPERHRQIFRGEKLDEARAPRALWQHLADELNKWLRPKSASKEEICDQILLEQFAMDLDEENQQWV
uniref:SCAN box domain-containing protein n=1 Tax=Crocodylus porosus TaxID=8502 RepID=A0A7M4EAT5_CROPO